MGPKIANALGVQASPFLTRWTGAAAGFGLGAFDTILVRVLGIDIELAGADATLGIGAFLTATYVVLGYLFGLVLEQRARERVAAARLAEQSQKLSEAQLRMAHADKLAALGQLAGTMAHELRNPLAIIRSTVQNLDETLSDDESRRSCRFVLEEIDRLTRVTSSIVRFVRPLTLARVTLSADEIVRRTGELAERMLAKTPVRLRVQATESGARLSVDPDLVCQALLGLIDNASRFSPAGGVIELGLAGGADHAEFFVDDTGPGVPTAIRDKLFEPFFTTRDEGAGLGLPVARQIAEAHGGRIEVRDRPGGGARFVLVLPAADSEELAA